VSPRQKKSFSQVFLRDGSVARRIIESLPLEKNKTILEIGPGDARMTLPLADSGVRLFCVEVDPVFADGVRSKVAGYANVRVINEDALKFDYEQLHKETGGRFTVFGNLPYSISTPLIVSFVQNHPFIDDVFIMVQKEVALKITSSPGSKQYGFLPVFTWPFFETEVLFHIGRQAFSPVPKVDSSFIHLKPRVKPFVDHQHISKYMRFARGIFDQRRKKMRNVVSGLAADKEKLQSVFEQAGIDPDSRPEGVGQEGFVSLFSHKSGHSPFN